MSKFTNKRFLILFLLILIINSQLVFSFVNPKIYSNSLILPENESLLQFDNQNNAIDSLHSPTNFSKDLYKEFQQKIHTPSLLEHKSIHHTPSLLEHKSIHIAQSLSKLLSTTPKEIWNIKRTQLLLTFKSNKDIPSTLLTKFNSEVLNEFPIAILDTTLDKVDEIKTIPGITGIFLDEHISLTGEEWEAKESLEPDSVSTYPSELRIGARYLQSLGINGSGVKIAILDTGIDKSHPDLDDLDNNDDTDDPKVVLEASFVDFDRDGTNDTNPMDDHYHGTHVAGIAAGNGLLKGVAPGAMLMNGKVLDKVIGGYSSWILKGIDWAVANGADIISMSIGGFPGNLEPLYEQVID
ncbi:MAG: S8 family peptidase, partial [Candidatus Hodarchaeales archaeon]